MSVYIVKSREALHRLRRDKALIFVGTTAVVPENGKIPSFSSVFKDDLGNYYQFTDKPATISFTRPNTPQDSFVLNFKNLLKSLVKNEEEHIVNNNVIKTRYPQEKLLISIKKKYEFEDEAKLKYLEELSALTGKSTQEFSDENCIPEKELIKKALENVEINTNPADINLKNALQSRAEKLEAQELEEESESENE